ncbi:Sensor protein kinase WalK [Bacillus sp. THAF10]|uniref:histidine kinase dimerization/phospho-acceptor domain-containing protein n=1 Tax=Bacillus sp. THAF10 TaxID=2587848 RepID=UPI0012681310|nr:histidine kinase dimerization/phospho-acceptor domain-containing protein [Bacillus sp. THAF10]QFT89712.1 Sensor protein kinase WalK [Bacillus sp. THAF10]
MGTKWKSRLVTFFVALIFVSSCSGALFYMANKHRFYEKNYFYTGEFNTEFSKFHNTLAIEELTPLTVEKVMSQIEVTKEEIEDHRYRYGSLEDQLANIRNQYEERIRMAEDGESFEDEAELKKELNQKLEDIRNNFESDDHIKEKIVAEKEKEVNHYFENEENFQFAASLFEDDFVYYIEEGEELHTNANFSNSETLKETFSKNDFQYSTEIIVNGNDYFNSYNWPYEDWLYQAIYKARGQSKGEIGVPKNLSPNSDLLHAKEKYEQDRVWFWRLGVGSIMLMLLTIPALWKLARLPKELGRMERLYLRIPIDFRLAIAFATFMFAAISFYWINNTINYAISFRNTAGLTELIISITLTTFLGFLFYEQVRVSLAGITSWKAAKEVWEKSVLAIVSKWIKASAIKIYQYLQAAFLQKSVGVQAVSLLAIIFCLGLAWFLLLLNPLTFIFYLLLIIFVGGSTLLVLLRQIGYLNKISIKMDEMAAGKLGGNLDVPGNSVMAKMAANLNQLKQGVTVSQNEQAKSERLKTELITNVSHDLRTPLTSIITYTELLKKNDITDDDRAAYLEIIDRKSQRLKGLIDDLFEVSKMASGNIELIKAKVDINQLLQQALAEYGDNLESSNLQFRVHTPETKVFAMVDGQKIWRVFDNLIGNIIKYSLEHSRVYIQVQQVEGNVKITFKNVSKYELNDQSEELYERFKRGDTSRNTEGSGLGLAIAKSIIDLHQGSLSIDTDGDLFKVTVILKVVD